MCIKTKKKIVNEHKIKFYVRFPFDVFFLMSDKIYWIDDFGDSGLFF